MSEGGEIAVNLNAVAWQKHLNDLLSRDGSLGGVITIDYGFEDPREVRPGDAPQDQDSLQGASDSPGAYPPQPNSVVRIYPPAPSVLTTPGELDLTTDIDFRVLAQVAREGGLGVAFSDTLGAFATACGVPPLSQLEATVPTTDAMAIRTHTAQLLHAYGDCWRVLVLTKGISVDFGASEQSVPSK